MTGAARQAVSRLRRMAGLLELRPKQVALSIAAGAAGLGSAVALIGVSAWLIARASQQPPIAAVSLAVVAVRGLGVSRGVFRYVERLISHDVALRGLVSLRERCYRSLAAADTGGVARVKRGDLLARLGADVDAVGDTVVKGVLPFAVAAVVGGASVVALAVVLPVAALPLLAGLLLAGILSPVLAARAAREAHVGAAQARAAVAEQTQSLLDGLAELEVAGATASRRAELDRAERRLTDHLDAAARPAALAAAVQAVATGASLIGALLLGAGPVANGDLGAVWLPVLVLVPLAAFEATAQLPAAAVELVRGDEAARRLFELLDLAHASESASPTAQPLTNVGPGPHALAARDLVCGWEPDRPVVTATQLDLTAGRAVAVLGMSGSGKSTLLATLAGLLPPLSGRVMLDGMPIGDIAPADVRRVVSYTAEDAHVFATTVRENLRVAAGEVDDAALFEALDDVGLVDWVRTLPEGLGTVIGSGGHDVSGGERRRLLLARALLTGADILLLDEPGEHLDRTSARGLAADLADTAHETGRTVVLVTHSPDGLEGFDEVLEIRDGALRSVSDKPDGPAFPRPRPAPVP
jgi:ATP-binding cassette subfamily C protein CydC